MKILTIYDFDVSRNGGIETHIRNINRCLNSDYNVTTELVIGEKLAGFRFLGKNIRSSRALRRQIEKVTPDLIHIHGFASLFVIQSLNLCFSMKYPVVYTPHFHPFSSLKRPWAGRFFFHLFQKKLIRQVTAVIALTPSEAVFFEALKPQGKVTIIPNGINLTPRATSKCHKERAILFVGRNDHNKRLDFLLGQKEFLAAQNITVYVVTDTELDSDPPFHFFSGLSQLELEELYMRVSGVVIPSRYEAFSLVALEAMAQLCWVLASDQVQIKDYFSNELFFRSFTFNDSKDFQDKLLKMLELPECDENRMLSVLEQFTWSKVASQVHEVYDRVLSEKAI